MSVERAGWGQNSGVAKGGQLCRGNRQGFTSFNVVLERGTISLQLRHHILEFAHLRFSAAAAQCVMAAGATAEKDQRRL